MVVKNEKQTNKHIGHIGSNIMKTSLIHNKTGLHIRCSNQNSDEVVMGMGAAAEGEGRGRGESIKVEQTKTDQCSNYMVQCEFPKRCK